MRHRTTRRFGDGFRTALLAVSSSLVIALTVCYGLRPDAVAAVTIWPVWIWFCVGIWLALSALCRENRRAVAITSALWFAFLLVFADEPLSLLRGALPAHAPSGSRPIRIISLNCAGGDPLAAEEVAAYKPDIVLLQESPVGQGVKELAQRLFGDDSLSVQGPDASILARGKVFEERVPADMKSYVAAARVELPSGQEIRVISLRLQPQTVRFDPWSPDCRRVYSAIRRAQRLQTTAVAALVEAGEQGLPVIVGGDFNAPQRDAIFAPLRGRLHDAFAEAGVGWGNTMMNETPMLRIDQVWISNELQCVYAVARRTVHSDHRMVVCDIVASTSSR